ncbi:hypothetical protein HU200_026905 [Digitaria exilis]|uniref:VQ domain-containing protein n=1 Tax=Digitaria exilis TaxID=1010633 RepID=A0A835BYZ7_9POAL|nr:hypothetical protein HU200_026905 [Digitaria exilis]
MDGIPRKQLGSENNAHQGSAAMASTSSGKRKAKAAAGRGKKPPVKVVYIGNPMRVTTSEAGFRALVQELTGRHADPYKRGGGGSSSATAIDVDAADDSSGGSPVGAHLQAAGALMTPSPVSTPSSDAASATGAAAHAASSVPAAYYDDDGGDSFATQLIDNYSYCVFSPPTFLYGPHGELR